MIEEIKKLREMTGVGLTEAKQALQAADGDFDKALEAMRAQGLAKVAKRAERETTAGVIGSYLHDGRIGVMIEVACETDFVARNQLFVDLVHNLTLQIASQQPAYVDPDHIPAEILEKERQSRQEKVNVAPEKLEMVMTGQMNKFYQEVCLLNQSYLKDGSLKVSDYLAQVSAQLGEKIVVIRFIRWELGEA